MPKTKISLKEFVASLDRLPDRERLFSELSKTLSSVARFYGFEKMHTPVVEDGSWFGPLARAGFLEERPPVYCRTRKGEDIALRPSAALSILRAYGPHKMNDLPHPLKFFFEGEGYFSLGGTATPHLATRYELGLTMIGEEGPIAEAEIVQVIWKFLETLKLGGDHLNLRVNATGCAECRPSFRSQFSAYFRARSLRLCKNCKRYLRASPAKVLMCEEEKCRNVASRAPQVLDFLCELCKKHLRGFLEFLDEVSVPYLLDPKFFRDSSWFNLILYELSWLGGALPKDKSRPFRGVLGPAEGTEMALEDSAPRTQGFLKGRDKELPVGHLLMEGGRMSRVGELILGKRLDVASGIILGEALEAVLREQGSPVGVAKRPKIFLAQLGELAKRKSMHLLELLRANAIDTMESLGRDSVKSQLKVAERVGAEMALILGQKEALDNTIIVREISSGIQETIPQEKLIEFLRKKLKK